MVVFNVKFLLFIINIKHTSSMDLLNKGRGKVVKKKLNAMEK